MPQTPPLVSVIVPVHNGSAMLTRCLAAITASDYEHRELIVVDDSSSEDIRALAERFDARYLRLDGGPFGPAEARNRGARVARGTLLFFTDADVEVHTDTLRHAVEALADPRTDAVFGSYDDQPGDPGFLSQYKNLFHHFVHQHANEEASTFWSGCGAIRRDVFLNAGGFDHNFQRPSIEDIEFGVRLAQHGGRIRLVKNMQVRHLKRWTFRGLLHTEVFDRGVPWTVLILRTKRLPADLNLKPRERMSGVLTLSALGALVASPLWLPAALIGTALLAAFVMLNTRFYRFFADKRGWWFAARAFPYHLLYFVYSAASLALGILAFVLGRSLAQPGRLGAAAAPLEPAD